LYLVFRRLDAGIDEELALASRQSHDIPAGSHQDIDVAAQGHGDDVALGSLQISRAGPGMEIVSFYGRSGGCGGGISKSKNGRTQEYGDQWNRGQACSHDLDVLA
jgi:hypothetical protein